MLGRITVAALEVLHLHVATAANHKDSNSSWFILMLSSKLSGETFLKCLSMARKMAMLAMSGRLDVSMVNSTLTNDTNTGMSCMCTSGHPLLE